MGLSVMASGCLFSKSTPATATSSIDPHPTPTPTLAVIPTGEVVTVDLTTTGSHHSNECFAVTATGIAADASVVTSDRDVTFSLLTTSSGGFYPDATCGAYENSATLAQGQSAMTLYYKDTLPQAMLLTASYNGNWGVQLSLTLPPPPIHALLAYNRGTAGAAAGGGPCHPVGIVVDDASPGPMIQSMTQDMTITFTITSGPGRFYSDAVCTAPVTTATVLAGYQSVTSGLYFGGTGGSGTTQFTERWTCGSNSGSGFSSSLVE